MLRGRAKYRRGEGRREGYRKAMMSERKCVTGEKDQHEERKDGEAGASEQKNKSEVLKESPVVENTCQ